MRARLLPVLLLLGACLTAPAAAPVLVVRGTVSTPDAAERNYANRTTDRIVRWLDELGMPQRVLPDEAVTVDALRGTRIAILPYNPKPPSAELRALRAFLADGGKLIVCYAAEPALAAAMGLVLGDYKIEQRSGQWAAFAFNASAPPHLPERVMQSSRNIRPVRPADPSARVIATWEPTAPNQPADPAWVASPQGYWMTHVLLDDGDTQAKQRLLLGLLGSLDPELWEPAARHALARAGVVGPFAGLDDAVRFLSRLVAGTTREPAVMEALSTVQALHIGAQRDLAEGHYPRTIERTRDIRRLLVRAYGLTQEPRVDERRAVWNHSGLGLYPGDWDRTCRLLAEFGMTDLLVNLLWPGLAHYPSEVLATSDSHRQHGDQAAQALAAAHRHGLKLHAWKVCWRLDAASADVKASLRREGRLQVTDTGETIDWLCPSDPRNLILEKDAVRELVRLYDLDGIHLDYIRYRDSRVCFCAGCRARFEAQQGRPVRNWPLDARSGRDKEAFSRWRNRVITGYVRDVSALARRLRPGIVISAAVFGRYPLCVDSVAQDWGLWLRNGDIDLAFPMNYTADLDRFRSYVRLQLALPEARGRVIPGIGVTAAESRLDAIDTMEQIAELRRQGAPGFALYELNRVLETEILPALSLGATLRDATVSP